MTANDINGLILLLEAGVITFEDAPHTYFLNGPERWTYLWLDKPSFVLNWRRWALRPGGSARRFNVSQRDLSKLGKALKSLSEGGAMVKPLTQEDRDRAAWREGYASGWRDAADPGLSGRNAGFGPYREGYERGFSDRIGADPVVAARREARCGGEDLSFLTLSDHQTIGQSKQMEHP